MGRSRRRAGGGVLGEGAAVAAEARRRERHNKADMHTISRILDFSRRLTIVFKRPSCELVHQEWLTTARGHTVASCDERGLACAAHTDVVYIHICGHVSAGSGHEFSGFFHGLTIVAVVAPMAASRRAIGTLASSSTGGNTTKPTSHKSDGDACHEHRDARPCEHRGRIRLHTVR